MSSDENLACPAPADSTRPGARRVLLISHEPEAPAAVVGAILVDRGFETSTHVVLADPQHPNVDFPDPANFDLVVAFGSFTNAYDEAAQGWVHAEVDYISRLAEANTGYFGVCFGAQLLGQALGGEVVRIPGGAEVGAIGIASSASPLPFPAGPWFSWHEDRIDLPQDSNIEVLASTDAGVQVFRTPRAIGVQFHPEANQKLVGDWVAMGADHLPSGWTGEKLLQVWSEAEPEAHANCVALVDWIVAELVDSA